MIFRILIAFFSYPVNPVDPVRVLRSDFRGFASKVPGFSGMEPYFRFALSHPVSTVVIGCDNIIQLEENVCFAESFEPMTNGETQDFINQIAPYAKQLMYYKP